MNIIEAYNALQAGKRVRYGNSGEVKLGSCGVRFMGNNVLVQATLEVFKDGTFQLIKEKVKKWKWAYEDKMGEWAVTRGHYAECHTENWTNLYQKIDNTEIEVEE